MKKNKGKIWILVIAVLMLLLLGWTFWQNAKAVQRLDNSTRTTVMIEGEYSIDGGEWKPIDNEKPIEEHFHKAVFKGKPIKTFKNNRLINIMSKNVWYTLSDKNGNILTDYKRSPDEEIPEQIEYMGELMPKTPGYYVNFDFLQLDDDYQAVGELILEVEYPYERAAESFSDCFYVLSSYTDSIYTRFFFEMLPAIIMFLLVCFFGVFFFPIASGLLGRIDFRYIAFGALCFFAGLYMVIDRVSEYLNLWIIDPTVCMMTDKIALWLFALAVIIYLCSLLQGKIDKIIASSAVTVFFLLIVTTVILHATGTADMMVTSASMFIALAAILLIMTVLLCMEIKGKKGFALLNHLIAWVPLFLSIGVDIADTYLHIPGDSYLRIGLAITILYQMVRFGADFRRQYKEAIHYQQVQRELYEAKVSVMVSQIRPHFMYNALSSIAMLCKLNPDTAYEATVTFSDYLRGNMDSLKQTAPVPFAQELEHLKKYLYIEKLRFADKLHIEFDIQATDFVLPQLSVQPLVENAVKHGVGMKKKGGTVTISSGETDAAYEVIIQDDGVGFDVNEKMNDGRSHIGMENTRKRIKDMCGGEVIIESTVGEGTTARVILPKEGQDHEDTMC